MNNSFEFINHPEVDEKWKVNFFDDLSGIWLVWNYNEDIDLAIEIENSAILSYRVSVIDYPHDIDVTVDNIKSIPEAAKVAEELIISYTSKDFR